MSATLDNPARRRFALARGGSWFAAFLMTAIVAL